VDLNALYARHGLAIAANELPDYLPAVLEYLSMRPLEEVREMLGDLRACLRAVGEALASMTVATAPFWGIAHDSAEAAFDFHPQPSESRTADAPGLDESGWINRSFSGRAVLIQSRSAGGAVHEQSGVTGERRLIFPAMSINFCSGFYPYLALVGVFVAA